MSLVGRFLVSVGLAAAPTNDAQQDVVGLETVAPLPLPTIQAPPFAPRTEKAMAGYRELLAMDTLPEGMRFDVLQRVAELDLEHGLALLATSTDPDAALARVDAGARGFAELLALADARGVGGEARALLRYQHARSLEALGRGDEAMDALIAAFSDDPEGPHAAEIAFRIGERRFAADRIDDAVSAYESAIALDDARFALQARYRLGWAQQERLNYRESINAFVDLLAVRFPQARSVDLDELAPSARSLVEDALRGLALSVVRSGDPDALDDALAPHRATAFFHLPYAALTGLLLEQERWRDAADVADRFVAAAPTHPLAPRFAQGAVAAWEEGGFAERAESARIAFVDRFDPAGPWYHDGQSGDVSAVRDEVRRVLVGLAREDHARSQADDTDERGVAARKRAIDWYQRLLRHFAVDPATGEIADGAGRHAFLLAELHTDASEHGEAARRYRQSAYELGVHDDAAEAGYAAILALRAQPEATDPGLRDALEAASHRFADVFPADPRVAAVLLTLAEARFAEGDHDAALAAAERVAAPVASALQLEQARTLRAESHDALGDAAQSEVLWALLEDDSRDPEARADYAQRRAASVYAQGAAARTEGDDETAVGHFLRLVELAPGTAEARSALYDAAAIEASRERPEPAAALYRRFLDAHGSDPLAGDARRGYALALRAANRTAEAASAFQDIAEHDGTDDALRLAAWDEALSLRRQVGDVAAEDLALRTFLDALETIEQATAERASRLLEARWRRVELAAAPAPETDDAVLARWGELLEAAEPRAEVSPRARSLAARAALALAAPLHAEFSAVVLRAPLADALETKRARMERALSAYARAAAFAVDDVVSATTHRTGLLYLELADALLASERPEGLAADALAQYELLLEEQAWPFEAEALALFETNAERTRTGRWDEAIEASFSELARRSPGRWARPVKGESLEIALHQ